jgi:hypothetical protein
LFGDGCGQKKRGWKFGTSQHKKQEEEGEAPVFVLVIVIAIFV